MTTENSGEAVCCPHAEYWHGARHERFAGLCCALCVATNIAPEHDFQPAPENSDGSVPAEVEIVHTVKPKSVTIADMYASTDRIQEALLAYEAAYDDTSAFAANTDDYYRRLDEARERLIARVRESVEDEQREKYEALVKAASYVLSRRPYVPAEAWAGLHAALSSTEIKGETTG